VKYTTARLLAEQTVDLVMAKLGRGSVPCRTSSVPLPGAFAETPDALVATLVDTHRHWLDKSSAAHLATAYGTDCHKIVALAAQDQRLQERVTPDSPVLRAEVVHAVRHEMALTLTDVVVRRTPLGTAGHPGSMVAQVCTEILGRELHWTAERASGEVEHLRAFYDPVVA
jgi:glycerol-3-phosphate dehydrogenase